MEEKRAYISHQTHKGSAEWVMFTNILKIYSYLYKIINSCLYKLININNGAEISSVGSSRTEPNSS